MTTSGPRDRLLLSAIALMCERGVQGTGLSDLLAHSRTARGSIYQHFPGGKSELMEEATYTAGRTIGAMLDNLLSTHDAVGVIDGTIDYWKQVLTGSDYAMGCPILAASQCGPSEPGVQAASAAVFAGWTDKIATALRGAGVEPATAKSIASTTVSSIAGAVAQSRSSRTTDPLDDVRAVLKRLVASAIPG